MASSRRKNGIWEKTKLDFIPVSNNALDLQKCFYKFLENMKNSTLYYGSKEEMDRRITDFPQFCFTYECLNTTAGQGSKILLLMAFFVTIRQPRQIASDSVYFEGLGGCQP